MTTRYKYLWLVPALALAACGDNTGGGTPPPPAEDGGADVVKDTGDDATTMDAGDDVITPVDNGPDVIKQPDVAVPDAGDDVVTPPDAADDVVTPTDAVDDLAPTDATPGDATPGDATPADADDVVTPTDTAVDTGPVCPTGQSLCGTTCVDTSTSAANCGTCGNACGAGTECRGGGCVPVCRTGESLCGTPATCTATQSDINNCGGCGTVCPSGQMCVSGACSLVCAAPQVVCTAASGARSCVDTTTDNSNCGACGNACAMGQSCVAGACIVVCPTGQTACGSACFDLASSNANCGSCGTACATGETCAMGRCQRTCATGETLCGTSCVNTATDTANCGRCGTACAMSQSCTAGACACPTGQTLCGTGAAATCLDLTNNTLNCGMCGRACATGQNCTAGACVTTAPVNDLPAGAITINLAAPSQTITGATAGAGNQSGCLSGGDVYYRFTLTQREFVYVDTFGTSYDTALAFAPSTGTGTITGTCTDDSCGGLQTQLARQLDAGTYYLVVSGFSATSSGPFTLHFQHLPVGSGAVTALATPVAGMQTLTGTTTGTGVLTQSCTTAPGPETSYWFTTCPAFTALNFTATTCGGTPAWDSVLEQRSAARAALAVCNDDTGGTCGTQSTISGTIAAGAGLHTLYVDGYSATALGAYTLNLRFGACATGQTLCGATCVDTQTSATNCGTCGTACGTGQVCTAGRCGCPTGQLLCGGVCVNAQTSVTNCGACGRTCLAGQSCTAGVCACPTGTNVCGTACVNLQTSATNCGTCGTTCPSGAACTAGACVCPAGQTACGATCRTLATDNANCGACGRVCAAGNTCQASVCRPANDARASAIAITLPASGAEATVSGTTVGATADGPTDCASTPNVWYSVTLATREVLYVDTAGSGFDTRLSIVNSAGTTVAGTCNDDASCTTGGFTSTLQSRATAVLAAGTYFINVAGFNATATGTFTLHVQHIRTNLGSYFYEPAIAGTATTASTTLVGTSAFTPSCTAGPSGEDVRWFVTCGSTAASTFSLCASDGATYTRRIGTTDYDPSMAVYAGASGTQVQCNDDGAATNCRGTGGDTLNYGSRISAAIPRGINAVVVDERTQARGMVYTMRHIIQ